MNGISGICVDVDLNQESRINRFFAVKEEFFSYFAQSYQKISSVASFVPCISEIKRFMSEL